MGRKSKDLNSFHGKTLLRNTQTRRTSCSAYNSQLKEHLVSLSRSSLQLPPVRPQFRGPQGKNTGKEPTQLKSWKSKNHQESVTAFCLGKLSVVMLDITKLARDKLHRFLPQLPRHPKEVT